MRTTINHALDILEAHEESLDPPVVSELLRVVRRVQSDYLEIIENALSLLVQDKQEECRDYLRDERTKLEATKDRIAGMINGGDRWPMPLQRQTIEYLFTRARLVDEIRMFPEIVLELLERMTLDQSLAETIAYLEHAMTGKRDLMNVLLDSAARHSAGSQG